MTLASNNASLTVPASVTVTAGATTATFSATAAASIASNQSVTLTATLGGSSKTATISLLAPLLVSGVACIPTTLGQSAVSTCTVTLTQTAPTGGSSVTLASNKASLTVPASVMVAAGDTTATFSATAAASIASNQSATVTATLGTSSQTATISLLAPVLVSGVACSPGSLGQSAVSTCTVTLTQTASTGGSSVTLASNNASLTVPASVTVAVGATTATFSATAAALIASNQSATVTATLGSSSETATISLLAAVSAISLVHMTSCGLQTFPSTCTIPATGSGNLIVVAWGSGPYVNPTVSSITDNAGNIYAEAGDARATDPVAGSIDIWYAANSKSGATSVTVTPSASGTDAVVIWEFSNVALTSPLDQTSVLNSQLPTITPAGASVTTTVPNEVVISVLTPSGATIGLQLGSAFTIDSFLYGNGWSHLITSSTGSYAPQWDIALGSYASSTVSFKAASGSVTLTSDNRSLTVPASGSLAAGATAAVSASPSSRSAASMAESSLTQLKSISCKPGLLRAGAHGICEVELEAASGSASTDLQLVSSNQSVKLPPAITIGPGKSKAKFRIDGVSPANDHNATIMVQLGTRVVQETVSMDSRYGPLDVPSYQYVKFGTRVQFHVSSPDPAATLTASGLPAGAVFDPVAGVFWWVPEVFQQGHHQIVFMAVDPAGGSITSTSILEVDSGAPVVTRVVNAASRSEAAACSPGSIASLEGRWLVEGQATSDTGGLSTELSGTVVRVNGIEVPVLSASISRVDFLCPAAEPGSTLEIALQTLTGVAQPIQTVSREATPGIFSLDESGGGAGMITHSGTATLVMTPDYRRLSSAALPGELVTVYATGIAAEGEVSVAADGMDIRPQSIIAVPELAGIYQVSVRLPSGLSDGDIPVSIKVKLLGGAVAASNDVSMAIESLQH